MIQQAPAIVRILGTAGVTRQIFTDGQGGKFVLQAWKKVSSDLDPEGPGA
jgi:hypothetical protein